jgi:ABC-type transporter Mla subunit MlaD
VKTGDLDELPRQLGELRELIREAHGATKDLNRAIREARDFADNLVKMVDAAADASRRAAWAAGAEQLAEYQAHIQGEMNRSAAELNKAIVAAREHIGRALRPKIASIEPEEGTLVIQFEGALFDADVPAGGYQ